MAGTFAPGASAAAQGQLLSAVTYPNAFDVLDTAFGGDGFTTFGVPDLQGRTVDGTGSGPGLSPVALGEKIGADTATIARDERRQHGGTGSAGNTGDSGAAPKAKPVKNFGLLRLDYEALVRGAVEGEETCDLLRYGSPPRRSTVAPDTFTVAAINAVGTGPASSAVQCRDPDHYPAGVGPDRWCGECVGESGFARESVDKGGNRCVGGCSRE